MRDDTTKSGALHFEGRRSALRSPAVLAVLGLVLIGCGGSDDAGEDPSASPTTTTPSVVATTAAPADSEPEPDPTTTTAAAPAEPSASVDVSEATVVVGDETYSFGSTGFITERCNPNFFGGAQVILQLLDVGGEPLTVGDQMVFLDVALIPDDASSTTIGVPTPEPDREWIADSESLQVSGTSVDEWSIEGNRITGTATFASTAGEGPVPGTFEIVCADE